MPYKVIHISNGNSSVGLVDHGQQVQEALDQIGEAEIYSVQHSFAGQYGQYVSTLIVFRDYEG